MSAIMTMRGARMRVRFAAGVLAVMVVAAGGIDVWYRQTYNVWPGQGASARVHWCGRNYESGGTLLTWPQITSGERFPIRLVARYPPLGPQQELFAASTPEAQRFAVSPPLPCAMVVYLRVRPDKYQAYSLLGGP